MKTRIFSPKWMLFFISLILLVPLFNTALRPVFAASPSPVKRALLIGIGKYQALPRLPGSTNDIDLVYRVLVTRFGFSEKHIRTVVDEGANRAEVLAALSQIVKDAGPNDVVYIHYSGHGSQVEDLNGDEPDDQLDETIVPADGRTEGIPDITDDELENILAQLKTPNAVVVLDSCHSGTATRGLQVRARAVPKDTRIHLYKKAGVTTRAIVPMAFQPYVLFSGAASHEEALDGPVNGQYHGFFTHSLFKSLQSVPNEASIREVFAGAKQELKRIQNQFGRTSMPEPQLEAQTERIEQPFFVVRSTDGGIPQNRIESVRRSWVPIVSQKDDGAILVNAVSLGAVPGSVWGIYPEGETDFNPAEAQAFAVVQSVKPNQDAWVVISPQHAKLPAHGRAVLVAPAPGSKLIPIALRGVSLKVANQLQALLEKEIEDITFVGEQEFARFIIELKNEKFYVLSADGGKEVMVLPRKLNPQSIESLSHVLVQSRNASQLLNLENPISQMKLSVRVVRMNQRGIMVVNDTMEAPVYHIRTTHEPRSLSNSLQLEVTSDTDAYITIVDVDAEGNLNVLFPNSYQNPSYYPDGFIEAGRTVLLPDSLQSGNEAGFHWDYANPPGVDTIRVFASTDRQLTDRIRQSIETGRIEDLEGGRQGNNSLTHLASLRQGLIETVTRGLVTVPDDFPTTAIPSDRENVESPPEEMLSQMPQDDLMMDEIGYGDENTAELSQSDLSLMDGMSASQSIDPQTQAQGISVRYTASDWTAASVTVLVQP